MEDLSDMENLFSAPKTSFLTVGGIKTNCVKVLPSQGSGPQDIVLGDIRGVIYFTTYNKTEPEILSKTNNYSKEITCVQVIKSKDLIYFSTGASVFGFNRNQQNKSKIEFNIATDINFFKIINNDIWTCTQNYLSHFSFGEMTEEKYLYDNECNITAMNLCTKFNNVFPYILIGSVDSKIKILEKDEVIKVFPVKGAVTCICSEKCYEMDEFNATCYYYGTSSGTIGCLKIVDKDNIFIDFEQETNKNYAEIVDIKLFDINIDGKQEIISIRSDGKVEVFNIEVIGNEHNEIAKICTFNTHEHLTSLDVGRFKDKHKNEIILSSLSGLLFSLTPEIGNEKKLLTIDRRYLAKKMMDEEKEVENLRETLRKKIEAFKKSKQTNYNPVIKNTFKIEHKFMLNQNDNVFLLTVDTEFPIEMAILHCANTILDILSVQTQDCNMNIIEDTVKDEETKDHSKFLATLRFKEATHRLVINIRTYEGIKDDLNITIIPVNNPKTAQIVQIPIYALSFHKKYEPEYEKNIDNLVDVSDPELNNVLIIEDMRGSEINQILHLIVPDIPDIIRDTNVKYTLRSTFMNTLLEVDIQKEKAEITSVFLPAICTLKRQIIKEVENRKKGVKTRIKIKKKSIFKILEILHPKIEKIFNLEKDFKIIKAFNEIGNNNIELNNLPEEYIQILNRKEEIENLYSNRTLNLKYYKHLIINLFEDVCACLNLTENKKDSIDKLFEDYSYEKLKEIFNFLYN